MTGFVGMDLTGWRHQHFLMTKEMGVDTDRVWQLGLTSIHCYYLTNITYNSSASKPNACVQCLRKSAPHVLGNRFKQQIPKFGLFNQKLLGSYGDVQWLIFAQ
jgi:hypothetical protein